MTLPAPQPGILDIAPYQGGESVIKGVDRVIKLSSNESALGPSPRAIEAYNKVAGKLHRYPDGSSAKLREAIGTRHGLDPERIVCGAGSDELIGLLVRAYCGHGDEVLYPEHGFLMYSIYAKGCGAVPVRAPERNLTADIDAVIARVTPRTKIVFITNPNNPTGTYTRAEELKRLRAALPENVLLVVDAAYAEFVDRNDYADGRDLVDSTENTVMLRTFSKIHGLGGARVGWGYFPVGIADVMNRLRSPFNVALPSQEAAAAAIADAEFTALAKAHNDYWLPWMIENLRGLGLEVTDSVGNFVLVRFEPGAKGIEAANTYLMSRGIIARRVAGYGLADWLRITIGRDDENPLVIDAIRDFLAP